MSVQLNLADKLIDLLSLSNNRKMRTAVKILIILGKQNFNYFKQRMSSNLSRAYRNRLNEIINKASQGSKRIRVSF